MRILTTLVMLAIGAASPAHAQQQDLESAVKATFLVRFASFVQWPAEAFPNLADPVVICVTGDAAFAGLVEAGASGERIGARAVIVRRMGEVSRNTGCHILYVVGSATQTAPQMLEIVRAEPVLTVTDERHARTRGMIHFVVEGGRVRFHVDRGVMERGRLSVSARLLNVALSVRGGGRS